MLGTYAALLLCLGASALVGQAIVMACGRRRWSRLAPAVGLAALCPLAWWAVRLPGEDTAAAVVIGLATALSALYVVPRVSDLGPALRRGLPIELAAVALASLPFIVEWRFGILGTGLNPDMSQHLFAVDRLAAGGSERLIESGYPLGPHSIVVAIAAVGPSTVHAFGGVAIAIVVATALVALGVLERLTPSRRAAGALLVGFAYLLASAYVQGSFKEQLEALFLLAFAVGLGEVALDWPLERRGGPRRVRAVPLGVLAIGAVYAYSFPGLVWMVAGLAVWAAVETVRLWRPGGFASLRRHVRFALPTALVAAGVLVVASLPELGRMIDFGEFETFDPAGEGLGNLFNRLSPLEALGVWPSGDFRIEPGGGAVPAIVFWAGSALAAAASAFGLRWWWRERERAVPAVLGGAVVLWIYALVAGTPYQEAKALGIAAPLVMLVSARALLEASPTARSARLIVQRRSLAHAFPGRARVAKRQLVTGALAITFLAAAAGSSLLVLVNGPVGPSGYSPRLAQLRDRLPDGSIRVVAPDRLIDEQHGADWIAWELRGNRICVEPESEVRSPTPPNIQRTLFVALRDGAVVPGNEAGYRDPVGEGPCPLIPDAARADPSAGG